jgi:site-specific recombinase XerC
MSWSGLRLHRSRNTAGDLVVRFGVALLDAYLEFLAVRSRPNTVVAVAYDLKVFFTVVGKPPRRVVAADVLGFVTAQYAGGPARRLQAVGEGGVSTRTVRRRLSSVSGLFAFLQARGDVAANPVPRGLPTRRERQRPRQGVPLVRTPRTLPRVLEPAQVDALLAALRTHRDRAMAEAMVLGGLRRCEVLGLRLADLQVAARRLFIAEGKGGHQRLIPVSGRFFASVAAYLDSERPLDADSDRVFVVLKGCGSAEGASRWRMTRGSVAARMLKGAPSRYVFGCLDQNVREEGARCKPTHPLARTPRSPPRRHSSPRWWRGWAMSRTRG